MSLLVVGSVAFDAIETPFGKTDKIIGGAGTYISLSASYFTKSINLISVVGGDFPNETLEMLNSKGINTEGIEIRQDEKTFFWSGKYHDNMNQRDTITTELNVLETFDPTVPDNYQGCDVLLLGNLSPGVQKSVIDRLNDKPKLIVMDTMNFWMDIMMDDLKTTIGMVDVLCINDEEARQLSDEYSLVTAAKKIMAMGPEYLIIKKGEHGALLFHGDKIFSAPGLPLEEVFDPTGAGDTFAGGFAGYLSAQSEINFDNMKKAIIYGSALASFCVEKFGIERITDLSNEDVSNRVAKFSDLIAVDL
ncbi:MAG: sugar kinase [Flavobacteriales bacterium]|nr:sugar kinase [Flavobacteriales bacterium]